MKHNTKIIYRIIKYVDVVDELYRVGLAWPGIDKNTNPCVHQKKSFSLSLSIRVRVTNPVFG